MSSPRPRRTYIAPKETIPLVQGHLHRCQNLRLILDRFVPQEVLVNKETWQAGKKMPPPRYDWLSKELLNGQRIDEDLWEALYQRWRARLPSGALTADAAVDWRMVVGLGGKSVLETDLTLDHLSGLPVIPGSALKGMTRAYAAQEKTPASLITELFGTQEQAGKVTFFDALPVPPSEAKRIQHSSGVRPELLFEVDIMNVHYPKYYQSKGGEAPTNDQNLNPLSFLTVAAATFGLAVAPRGTGTDAQAKQAMEWLLEALKKYGVGGKTSAGYGTLTALGSPRPVPKPAQRPLAGDAPKSPRDLALEKTRQAPAAAVQAAPVDQPRAPRLTLEQVEAWRKGKPALGGTVMEVTTQGTIVQISDAENAPRGFIVGQRLTPGMSVPPRKVIGLHEWQGEWFVKLS